MIGGCIATIAKIKYCAAGWKARLQILNHPARWYYHYPPFIFPILDHSFPYLPYLAHRSNLVQSIEGAAARGAQRAGHEEGVEAILDVLHHGFL